MLWNNLCPRLGENIIIKRTTKAQFELFKETAKNHLAKLGLYNWRIEFFHKDCGYSYATTDHNIENHCAGISLTTKWEENDYLLNNENIVRSAKHEVHHILLAKLSAYANYRFVNKVMLDQSEEEIVRILDTFL